MDLGTSKENEKGERRVHLVEKKSLTMCMMNLRMGYCGRDFQKSFRYLSLKLRRKA